MAGARLIYQQIIATNAALQNAAHTTVPLLNNVRGMGTSLLEYHGGLWLIQSSEMMRKKFDDFTTSTIQATNQIPMWAKQFESIMNSVKAMDEQLKQSASL